MALTCDFCTAGTPAGAYLVGAFSVHTPLENNHNLAGAWAACQLCAELVDPGRLNALVDRVMRVMAVRGLPDLPQVREHYRLLLGAVLNHRGVRLLPLDDAQLQPFVHVDGQPIGVMSAVTAEGDVVFAEIPQAPPYPLRP